MDGYWFLLEINTLFRNEALNARGIRLGPLIRALREHSVSGPVEAGRPSLLLAC